MPIDSPPVATLLRWFPDRKGMASGMAIMGFGSGALVALPVIRHLVEANFVAPKYFGSADTVQTVIQEGRRFLAESPATEVVIASASDIAKLGLTQHVLEPGVYAVGTGSTGVAATMMTIGGIYAATMILASLGYKIPAENWTPPVAATSEGNKSSSDGVKGKDSSNNRIDPLIIPAGSYVTASDAIKSRQFAQVWTSLFLNATAGIAVLGVAKTLMSDVFGSTMPTIVDATFCAGYVGALSLFNGVGRLAWAATSDAIGRQKTYSLFFALGIPLYLSVPVTAHMVGVHEGVAPLAIFTASTLSIITMYGGGFSVSPAYLADLFGSREVGNIYGKLLTAWSVAGMVGPTLLAYLRRTSEVEAIRELATKVDPIKFQQQFGTSVDKISDLIDANTVNIAKLLHIAPAGTLDPSPYLYDSSMKTMAALLLVGLANNYLMKPVDPKLIKKI